MTIKETLSEQYYTELIGHASSVLKLSLSQVKEKYLDYPLCIMDYIEKDIHEKSIEVRFDKEEVTLTCTFNDKGSCDSTFLFPDNNQIIEEFVGYLTENHDYSFVKSRFILDNCFVRVKELRELKGNMCLAFY